MEDASGSPPALYSQRARRLAKVAERRRLAALKAACSPKPAGASQPDTSLAGVLQQCAGQFDGARLSAAGLGVTSIGPLPARYQTADAVYLSRNQLRSLQGMEQFQQVATLSLSDNQLQEFSDISLLGTACPRLVSLALEGNPLSRLPNYRAHVIQLLPQLQQLDALVVSAKERQGAAAAVQQEESCLALMVSNACVVHKLSRAAELLQLHSELRQAVHGSSSVLQRTLPAPAPMDVLKFLQLWDYEAGLTHEERGCITNALRREVVRVHRRLTAAAQQLGTERQLLMLHKWGVAFSQVMLAQQRTITQLLELVTRLHAGCAAELAALQLRGVSSPSRREMLQAQERQGQAHQEREHLIADLRDTAWQLAQRAASSPDRCGTDAAAEADTAATAQSDHCAACGRPVAGPGRSGHQAAFCCLREHEASSVQQQQQLHTLEIDEQQDMSCSDAAPMCTCGTGSPHQQQPHRVAQKHRLSGTDQRPRQASAGQAAATFSPPSAAALLAASCGKQSPLAVAAGKPCSSGAHKKAPSSSRSPGHERWSLRQPRRSSSSSSRHSKVARSLKYDAEAAEPCPSTRPLPARPTPPRRPAARSPGPARQPATPSPGSPVTSVTGRVLAAGLAVRRRSSSHSPGRPGASAAGSPSSAGQLSPSARQLLRAAVLLRRSKEWQQGSLSEQLLGPGEASGDREETDGHTCCSIYPEACPQCGGPLVTEESYPSPLKQQRELEADSSPGRGLHFCPVHSPKQARAQGSGSSTPAGPRSRLCPSCTRCSLWQCGRDTGGGATAASAGSSRGPTSIAAAGRMTVGGASAVSAATAAAAGTRSRAASKPVSTAGSVGGATTAASGRSGGGGTAGGGGLHPVFEQQQDDSAEDAADSEAGALEADNAAAAVDEDEAVVGEASLELSQPAEQATVSTEPSAAPSAATAAVAAVEQEAVDPAAAALSQLTTQELLQAAEAAAQALFEEQDAGWGVQLGVADTRTTTLMGAHGTAEAGGGWQWGPAAGVGGAAGGGAEQGSALEQQLRQQLALQQQQLASLQEQQVQLLQHLQARHAVPGATTELHAPGTFIYDTALATGGTLPGQEWGAGLSTSNPFAVTPAPAGQAPMVGHAGAPPQPQQMQWPQQQQQQQQVAGWGPPPCRPPPEPGSASSMAAMASSHGSPPGWGQQQLQQQQQWQLQQQPPQPQMQQQAAAPVWDHQQQQQAQRQWEQQQQVYQQQQQQIIQQQQQMIQQQQQYQQQLVQQQQQQQHAVGSPHSSPQHQPYPLPMQQQHQIPQPSVPVGCAAPAPMVASSLPQSTAVPAAGHAPPAEAAGAGPLAVGLALRSSHHHPRSPKLDDWGGLVAAGSLRAPPPQQASLAHQQQVQDRLPVGADAAAVGSSVVRGASLGVQVDRSEVLQQSRSRLASPRLPLVEDDTSELSAALAAVTTLKSPRQPVHSSAPSHAAAAGTRNDVTPAPDHTAASVVAAGASSLPAPTVRGTSAAQHWQQAGEGSWAAAPVDSAAGVPDHRMGVGGGAAGVGGINISRQPSWPAASLPGSSLQRGWVGSSRLGPTLLSNRAEQPWRPHTAPDSSSNSLQVSLVRPASAAAAADGGMYSSSSRPLVPLAPGAAAVQATSLVRGTSTSSSAWPPQAATAGAVQAPPPVLRLQVPATLTSTATLPASPQPQLSTSPAAAAAAALAVLANSPSPRAAAAAAAISQLVATAGSSRPVTPSLLSRGSSAADVRQAAGSTAAGGLEDPAAAHPPGSALERDQQQGVAGKQGVASPQQQLGELQQQLVLMAVEKAALAKRLRRAEEQCMGLQAQVVQQQEAVQAVTSQLQQDLEGARQQLLHTQEAAAAQQEQQLLLQEQLAQVEEQWQQQEVAQSREAAVTALGKVALCRRVLRDLHAAAQQHRASRLQEAAAAAAGGRRVLRRALAGWRLHARQQRRGRQLLGQVQQRWLRSLVTGWHQYAVKRRCGAQSKAAADTHHSSYVRRRVLSHWHFAASHAAQLLDDNNSVCSNGSCTGGRARSPRPHSPASPWKQQLTPSRHLAADCPCTGTGRLSSPATRQQQQQQMLLVTPKVSHRGLPGGTPSAAGAAARQQGRPAASSSQLVLQGVPHVPAHVQREVALVAAAQQLRCCWLLRRGWRGWVQAMQVHWQHEQLAEVLQRRRSRAQLGSCFRRWRSAALPTPGEAAALERLEQLQEAAAGWLGRQRQQRHLQACFSAWRGLNRASAARCAAADAHLRKRQLLLQSRILRALQWALQLRKQKRRAAATALRHWRRQLLARAWNCWHGLTWRKGHEQQQGQLAAHQKLARACLHWHAVCAAAKTRLAAQQRATHLQQRVLLRCTQTAFQQWRVVTLQEQAARLQQQVGDAQQQVRDVQQQLAAAQQEAGTLTQQLAAAEEQIAAAAAGKAAAEAVAQQLEQQLAGIAADVTAFKKASAGDFQQLQEAHATEVSRMQQQLDASQQQLEGMQQKLEGMQQRLSTSQQQVQELQTQLAASTAAQAAVEAALGAAHEHQQTLAAQLSEAHQQQRQQEAVAGQQASEQLAQGAALQQLRGQVQQLSSKLMAAASQLTQAKQQLVQGGQEVEAAKAASRDATLALAQQSLEHHTAVAALGQQLAAQEAAARQMQARYDVLQQHLTRALEEGSAAQDSVVEQLRQQLAVQVAAGEEVQQQLEDARKEQVHQRAKAASQVRQLKQELEEARQLAAQQQTLLYSQQQQQQAAAAWGAAAPPDHAAQLAASTAAGGGGYSPGAASCGMMGEEEEMGADTVEQEGWAAGAAGASSSPWLQQAAPGGSYVAGGGGSSRGWRRQPAASWHTVTAAGVQLQQGRSRRSSEGEVAMPHSHTGGHTDQEQLLRRGQSGVSHPAGSESGSTGSFFGTATERVELWSSRERPAPAPPAAGRRAGYPAAQTAGETSGEELEQLQTVSSLIDYAKGLLGGLQ